MAKTPNTLSRRLHELALEDPRGDVLADVLGTSLLRNAMYRRIECGAPWGMDVPQHDRATFYVVVRGTARVEVEGEPLSELSAGDTLFIPHGTAHVVRDAKQTKPVRVCDGTPQPRGATRRLGGTGAQSTLIKGFFQFVGRKPALLDGMPRVIRLTSTDRTLHRWTAATLQLLLAESASPGPASVLVLQRLADVLFVQTLRALAAQHSGLAALADPAIHEALSILHGKITHPWTVVALAKKVGLSRSGFAARFTALVGEPPLQYLTRWRMGRAAELLRDTRRRVAEIAGDVGYESVPSFNKAFRRWQGQSPTSFRARYA
jgi:AraC-like DNA-binding protein/mannose-6-phosphate isomerase-like protein (cupin superfamily)